MRRFSSGSILIAVLAGFGVLAAAYSAGRGSDDPDPPGAAPDAADPTDPVDLTDLPSGQARDFGDPPTVPEGPTDPAALEALDRIVVSLPNGIVPPADVELIAGTGDARLAWALTDVIRFGPGESATTTVAAIEQLTGTVFDPTNPWGDPVDHLIAWDTPAFDEYPQFKADLFSTLDPRWGPLFEGGDAIDWRHVSWGGVFIDDRPLGDPAGCPRGCIPALDDPATTDAAGGDWYPDDAIVFGVVVDDEARAYPKNIMEVHEMVNDTLGGRRLGIPYCTLCGSAQAYLTDELGDELGDELAAEPVFRTSGLLIRSNKMMYDLHTKSFVDTFLGVATSGPLAEAGVTFDQVSVVTSTWGDWKADHPDTTIVAEDGGLGRVYPADPLGGRDDDGPIFPIGDVDPRLPVQEPVLGVIAADGTPVAFHVSAAVSVLTGGGSVEVEGISLELDGSGVRAVDADGEEVEGHQAFWFAWSQFRPATNVWPVDYDF